MPFPNPATQFKCGRSGNANGRPSDPISRLLRRALNRPAGSGRGRTVAEVVVDALIGAAIAGDPKALQIVLDRTEGKPRRAVMLDPGGSDPPIPSVEVRYENDWRQDGGAAGIPAAGAGRNATRAGAA
jgi:hypothetical protein